MHAYEQLTGERLFNMSTNVFSLFVQDDWRVTDRFTLNLGLRYDWFVGETREQGVTRGRHFYHEPLGIAHDQLVRLAQDLTALAGLFGSPAFESLARGIDRGDRQDRFNGNRGPRQDRGSAGELTGTHPAIPALRNTAGE